MDFLTLAERLRQEAKRHVAGKEFTVTELANRVGVSQPAMSNFLSGKRNLKLGKLNALLSIFHLSVEQLLDPAPDLLTPEGVLIPLVRQLTAIEQPRITGSMVIDSIHLKMPLSKRKAGDEITTRLSWTRFVAIRVTRAQARFMHPLFSDNTVVVLDRHYQKLGGRFRGLPAVYAIAEGRDLRIGYLKQVGPQLELHPDLNRSQPLLITLRPARDASHHIIGRVCKILKDI